MRARPWLFLLAAAALVAAGTAAADPVGRYLYVAPMAGYTIFDGDFQWPGVHPLADDLYAGGRIGYQYGPAWAFELAGGYTPTSEDVSGGQDVSFLHATGNIVFSPWASRIGGPYVFAGGGLGRLNASGGEAGDADFDQGLLEGGGGLKLWLTDAIGVRLEARVSHWMPKDSEGAPSVNYVMLAGGLTFGIGARARDTDGDGVPDSRDKCVATPKGATVDRKGCPSDTDGDAVLDGIDQCADTPKGCTVDAKGCTSDADGDGVCDGLDQCPNTPTGLKVDEKGCVIELVERETELMDTGRIRLQNINFDIGKATLKPESFQTLDVVGTLLTQWPTLKIEIAGHTDDTGGATINRKLSQARAQSVLDYLKGKYPAIDATRFTAKGYGEDKPMVPNVDDASRAQNRRVEFTVLNKEVLRKEVERRRLLQKDEAAPADTTVTP
jgi:OmpA-OmpF porin, OOP family